MATYSERVKFLVKAAEAVSKYDKDSHKLVEDIAEIVKTINVSSAYAVQNRIGNTAIEVNSSVRSIINSIQTCLTVFKANEHNVGDFMTQVNNALRIIEDVTPGKYDFDPVSVNSDGNENITQSNMDTLCEILSKFMNLSSDTLMEVSHARGSMRHETVEMVTNIGTSLETFTNSVIAQSESLNNQMVEMAQKYKLEIHSLEEATSGLRSIGATEEKADVTFSGGDNF